MSSIPVLINDTLRGGDTFEIIEVTDPEHGTATIDTDKHSITYTPDPNSSENDKFDYMVCNENGGCSIARVWMTVNAVNDAPVAREDLAVTEFDDSVAIDVLDNDTDIDSTLDYSTLDVVGAPSHGEVSIVDNKFTYTPTQASGYTGIDTFTYRICDGTGGDALCSDTDPNIGPTQVTVHINGETVANDDAITMNEDESNAQNKIIDVLSNDVTPVPIPIPDPLPGPPRLEIVEISQPAHGSAAINNGNNATYDTITYNPDADWHGTDYFEYKMCNAGGICRSATVTVTVENVNDAPVAEDDLVVTLDDGSVTINVLLNDTDIDDDISTAKVTVPSGNTTNHGSVTINTSGDIVYTPTANSGYFGTDTFTYQVCDAGSGCGSADVTVHIVGKPAVVDDLNESTSEDTEVDIDVLANDEQGVTQLEIAGFTQPGHGSVIENANGTLKYEPHADWHGTDSFSYKVCITSEVCETATVSVTVNAINDTPVAEADLAVTEDDSSVVIDVLANDKDIENNIDAARVTVTDSDLATPEIDTGHGTVAIDPANGRITYTPSPNSGYFGTDTFTYQVCDDGNACTSAQVTTQINLGQFAVDDTGTTTEDTAIDIDVIDNDISSTNTLTVEALTLPRHGSTTVNGDGTINYVPDANWNGTDSFTYKTCVAADVCDTAVVDLTVSAANDTPVVRDDLASTLKNENVTIDVLANDVDVENEIDFTNVTVSDNDGTTPDVIDTPHGSVVIDAVSGAITYTPATDFAGSDSFTYQACDIHNGCETAQVDIIVNEASVAEDHTSSTTEDSAVDIAVLEGGPADYDVDTVAQPTHGLVSFVDNTITYSPRANWHGDDSFIYQICHTTDGNCDTAEVAVTVSPENDTPVAEADLAVTEDDSSVVIDVLANDKDIENNIDAARVTVTDSDLATPEIDTGHGTVAIDPANGRITYTPSPNSGYFGTDTFTYQVCDDGNACTSAQVTTQINLGQFAVDDTGTTTEDTAIDIDVIDNDISSTNTLTVEALTLPRHGSTTVNGDGTINYVPDANWNGTDSFTYKTCVAADVCDTAVVDLTVSAANDTPVASNDLVSTSRDAGVTVDVSDNDVDIENEIDVTNVTVTDNDGATPDVIDTPHGSVVIDPVNGEITYTPAAGYAGLDSFTYQICDADSLCDDAQVEIFVLGEFAVNDALTVSEDETNNASMQINVLANDISVSGLVIEDFRQAAHGTVTKVGNDTFKYEPDADWNGTDRFTYEICIATDVCDTAEVVVTVSPVNDGPVAKSNLAVLDLINDSEVIVDVLANDLDIDDIKDDLTVKIPAGSAPSFGNAVADPSTGAITYTLNPAPDTGYDDFDQFTYQVCDPTETDCDTQIVTIYLNGKLEALNDGDDPNHPITTNEDVAIDAINVLDNDTSPSSHALMLTGITQPIHGTTTDNGDGTIRYEPEENWHGVDSFTYMVCDAGGLCETATVTMTVNPVNDPPDGRMDLVVIENTVIIDIATEDSALHVEACPTTDPNTGECQPVIPDYPARLVFNAENWNIEQTVVVTAVSTPESDPSIMHFASSERTVKGLGDAGGINGPIEIAGGLVEAGDIALGVAVMLPHETNYYVPTGTVEIVDDTTLVYQDSEINDDLNKYADKGIMYLAILESSPTMQEFDIRKISGYQLVTVIDYTPQTGFTGQDTFDYQVCDTNGECSTATATVAINSGAALALPDVLVGTVDEPYYEDTPATIQVDNALSIIEYTEPQNGTVVLNGNTFTYSPFENSTFDDYFTYMACNASNVCGIAKVQVDIEPVNDMPVARNDVVVTDQNSQIIIEVLANDLDLERKLDLRTVEIDKVPAPNATAVPGADGRITYTPDPDFAGIDTFDYKVCDDVRAANGEPTQCAIATVTINVQPVPDLDANPPTDQDIFSASILKDFNAKSDEINVNEEESTAILAKILDNDTFDGLTPYVVKYVSEPVYGELTLTQLGDVITEINYLSDEDFNGVDRFSYMLCHPGDPKYDVAGLCDVAEVKVTVDPVNDAPVAKKVLAVGTQNSTVSISIPVNNIDQDGNVNFDSVINTSNPSSGSLEIQSDKITELNLLDGPWNQEQTDGGWEQNFSFYAGKDFVVFFASPTLFVDEATQKDVLNLYNDGSVSDDEGLLTDSLIAGLGMVGLPNAITGIDPTSDGIAYGGLEEINIFLGSGNDTFTVHSSAEGTRTNIIDDVGEDTFNVKSADGDLVIEGGVENDTFNIEIETDSAATVTLTGDDGDDTFHILSGSDAPNIDMHMRGGIGADTWTFSDDASLGSVTNVGHIPIIDGQGGSDTIDYSGLPDVDDSYTTVVYVDLSLGLAEGVNGGLTGNILGSAINLENVIGGDANDTLLGDTGDNTLAGGPGDDILVGLEGDDRYLFGNEFGNDNVIEGSYYDGSACVDCGDDTLDFSEVTSEYSVNFALNGLNSEITDGIYHLTYDSTYIENLIGGQGADTFDFADAVTIPGVIDGHDGDDTLDYEDYVIARDVFLTALGEIDGFDGTETSIIGGFKSINTITASSADDDKLTGLNANAEWKLEGDALTLDQYQSTRTLAFSNFDILIGGIGADTFSITSDRIFHALRGGSGDDTFRFASQSSLQLSTVNGVTGYLDGQGGIDELDYSALSDSEPVIVDLPAGVASYITSDSLGNVGSTMNIENARGGAADDHFIGDVNDNTFWGGAGDDRFDFFDDWGVDEIYDSAGLNDWINFSAALQDLVITLGSVEVTSGQYSMTHQGDDIERLTGGQGDDNFVFSANGVELAHGSGIIDGHTGTDTLDYTAYTSSVTVDLLNNSATGTDSVSNIEYLIGGSGNDSLTGDDGDNTIIGGFGNDELDGGDGVDTVDYSGASVAVVVDLSTGTSSGGGGDDQLSDIENVIATDFNDTLTSDTFDNQLVGGLGDDTYRFIDNWSNDRIIDIDGDDTIDYTPATENVAFDLAASLITDTDDITDYSGSIIETLIGGAGDDIFKLTSAHTYDLQGGLGDDTFTFSGTASLTGTIDGQGGTDDLDFSSYNSARQFVMTELGDTDGFDGSVANVSGGFSNIDQLIGSSADDELTGLDEASTWTINGNLSQVVVNANVLGFKDIDIIYAGADVDTFNILGNTAVDPQQTPHRVHTSSA